MNRRGVSWFCNGGGMSRAQTTTALFAAIACAALTAAATAGAAPGRYEVGISTITFTKNSVTTGEPRPLATLIWYPAVAGTGTEEALGRRDAEVVDKQFPWIVFSHGNCGRPRESSYLTMALASRGFVVAAPPHIGNTADEPAVCFANFVDSLTNRVPDVRFIVDSMLAENATPSSRFADRLRPEAVGIAGLSFGGFTTMLAAQREPRLRAALALVTGGSDLLDPNDVTIPTMLIGADHDRIVTFADSEKAYQRVAGPRFLVQLLAADHLSVVNDCFPLCSPTDIPQDKAHRIVVRFAATFFRYFLEQGHSGGMGSIRPMPRSVLTAEPWRAPPPTATP
jgi:predicted dienelactone hydrolase